MKLLVVSPGASHSTVDVYNGIVPELQKLGVEVHEYDLGSRIELSGRYLNMVYRAAKKKDPTIQGYSNSDVIYKASIEILERALRFDVDGVLIFSGMFVVGDSYVLLHRAHVRTAVLLSESPYDIEQEARILPWVDVAWTNERSSVRPLRKANPNVNYMPHAFNPEIHKPYDSEDPDDIPAHDVVFVGSMFAERANLLSKVDWTGIDFGLYGDWRGLPSTHKLRKHVAGGLVNNRYAAALYRKAKIGLNLYRESMGWGKDAPRITHAESMNPRTLELAACGTFQISQSRGEIAETFGPSIPTFTDAVHLDRLIHAYLDPTYGDADRANHADEARRRVQPHTFAARARTILDDLGRAEWPVPTATAMMAAE